MGQSVAFNRTEAVIASVAKSLIPIQKQFWRSLTWHLLARTFPHFLGACGGERLGESWKPGEGGRRVGREIKKQH